MTGPHATGGEWVVLVDPGWQRDGEPPPEAVVGGWLLDGYRPAGPGSPTDPVDATAQLAARGEVAVDRLLAAVAGAALEIAVDPDGVAVVLPAPDGVPCVLVASAAAHRADLPAAGWQQVTAGQLAGALPEDGIDVLVNPASVAPTRLAAGALRRFLADTAARG
jgi:hypothetical protein